METELDGDAVILIVESHPWSNDNPQEIANIGVAAHICAAAIGGPRYEPQMSSEERKSAENGIWLCQSCSKLIDDDVIRYDADLLLIWKENAERIAIAESKPFKYD